MERPRAVSVNSPSSYLWKSGTYKEDSYSSDFSRPGSEAGFIYAYSSQTLLQKAKSLKKTNGVIGATLFKSQGSPDSGAVSTEFSWSRTKSTVVSESINSSTLSPAKSTKPLVMKYVSKLSELFEKMEKVTANFTISENVDFYKATHELDGQTYILKKIRIFVKNDEDFKEHPSYDEIKLVKDNRLPFELRYVNSWIELDESSEPSQDGQHVLLCIQMRYAKD